MAGTDVECGFNYVYKSVPEAVKYGALTEEEVDKHVIRLLEGRFDLGEMDDNKIVSWSKIPVSVLLQQGTSPALARYGSADHDAAPKQ